MEQVKLLGGAGTPLVLEFAAAELGALQNTTTNAAAALIADALDLRHRLPRLWGRVCLGEVRGWMARKVCQATRHLSEEAARYVDAEVAGFITALSWGRFESLVVAKIIEADPEQAEARRRHEEAQRFVRSGQSNDCGLKTLVARARAGDVIMFVAMADRIAQILHWKGDGDPADVRRSKAVGILASPARALMLLREFEDRVLEEPCFEAPFVGESAADALVQSHTPGRADDLDALVSESDLHPSQNDADDPAPDRSAVPFIRLDGMDPDSLLPRATLYIHVDVASFLGLRRGVARVEGVGPVTLDQVREFLGADCRVTVQPVLDPIDVTPIDGYEASYRIRETLHLRSPADAFPFGGCTSRAMQVDHTIPYLAPDKGGPPGQTSLANLGKLTTYHHRLKTFSRWRLRQPDPGSYLWRSPHGWIFLTNGSGSHNLGDNPFAQAVWRAAASSPTMDVHEPPSEVSHLRLGAA
nr:DUF222 domain-containing protein [Microlunatus panaciterrae]